MKHSHLRCCFVIHHHDSLLFSSISANNRNAWRLASVTQPFVQKQLMSQEQKTSDHNSSRPTIYPRCYCFEQQVSTRNCEKIQGKLATLQKKKIYGRRDWMEFICISDEEIHRFIVFFYTEIFVAFVFPILNSNVSLFK